MRAGTASMMAVEGSGADPAGTYRPTLLMGRVMRSQRTPGMVSIDSGSGSCAAAKQRFVRRVGLRNPERHATLSRNETAGSRAGANFG